MKQTKTTIKNKNLHHANSQMNLPVDGIVQFKDGEAEVSIECAESLIDHPDFEIEVEEQEQIEVPKQKKESVTKGTKTSVKEAVVVEETEEEEDETEENETEEKDEIVMTDADIDSLTLEEAIEVAKQGKVKSYHLFKTNEKALKKLIKKHLKK